MAYVAWKITGLVVGGHRVSTEVEELGLDVPEMGIEGYPTSPEVSTVLVMTESVKAPTEAATFEPQPEPI